MSYHDMRMVALERWWVESANPLYVWEAIAFCLNADPPRSIPDWCLPVLAETAANITDLAWACGQGRMKHDNAADKLKKATGLVRQGKNCFRQLAGDAQAQHAALDETYGHDAAKALEDERSITHDRARRILVDGYRFLGLEPPSKLPPEVST